MSIPFIFPRYNPIVPISFLASLNFLQVIVPLAIIIAGLLLIYLKVEDVI